MPDDPTGAILTARSIIFLSLSAPEYEFVLTQPARSFLYISPYFRTVVVSRSVNATAKKRKERPEILTSLPLNLLGYPMSPFCHITDDPSMTTLFSCRVYYHYELGGYLLLLIIVFTNIVCDSPYRVSHARGLIPRSSCTKPCKTRHALTILYPHGTVSLRIRRVVVINKKHTPLLRSQISRAGF